MPYARKRKYPYRRAGAGAKRYRRGSYRRGMGGGSIRRRYRRVGPHRTRFTSNIPTVCYRKLHFCDHYNESSGAATFLVRAFRGNSVYDPDYTGVGGTPSGLTNYARMYLRYKVLAAKIKVTVNDLETYNLMFFIFACPTDQAAVIAGTNSSLQNVITEGYPPRLRRWCIIPGTSQSGTRMRTKSLYCTTNQVLGRGHDNDREAAPNGNPVEGWVFGVGCRDTASNTAIDYSLEVHVTYYVKFMQVNPYYYDA